MNAEKSAAVVRRWVAIYTRGLPSEVRQNRRDEIDDDLWSQLLESSESGRTDRSMSGEVVARLVLGIPADVSWRVEQVRFPRNRATGGRSALMHAPGLAILAILGGIGWAIWPIPQALVGREWPAGEPVSLLLFVTVVGGAFSLVGAVVGLALRAGDKIRPATAVIASLGALLGAVSLFGGAIALFVGLPLGSAVLLWELGRVGMIGAWLARAHVAAAALLLAMAGVLFTNLALLDDPATAVPVIALAIPYGLSWVAIGWSLGHVGAVPVRGATGGT
jgi:hypothetical protein